MSGMFGPDGHCAEDVGQWPDYVGHDAYGHIRESADLFCRLVDVAHEPVEQVKEHLVGDVAQIGDARGGRVGDQVHLPAGLRGPHEKGKYRTCDLEARRVLLHLEILAEHRKEAAEVCVAPVTARAFTLLNDRLDGAYRVIGVRYWPKLLPAEQLTSGLRSARAEEEVLLAHLLHQVA